MAKNDLFGGGDSDDEIKITINEEYASNYSNWRMKEEYQKLKDRCGKKLDNSESSSSEDDDNAKDLPILEKDFFRALAFIKKYDPRIHTENFQYHPKKDNPEKGQENIEQSCKGNPFLLREYERRLIVKKGGKLSDDEDTVEKPRASSSYIEELEALKESFKQALKNSDDKGEDTVMFKKKTNTSAELEKEEDYKEWLKGRKEEIQDKGTESDLKVLHDYWNDPNLNPDEAYLRDYILNKRFLEHDEDLNPNFKAVIDDYDEKHFEEQEQFEHRYNFRFEMNFGKFFERYPRLMDTSLRRKDDKREIKRQDVHERKEAAKATKKEILQGDVRELTSWCSIKKVVIHKPEHVEKYGVKNYRKRAKNETLKRKILPSLNRNAPVKESQNSLQDSGNIRKKGKKRKSEEVEGDAEESKRLVESSNQDSQSGQHAKKKPKRKQSFNEEGKQCEENLKKEKKQKHKEGPTTTKLFNEKVRQEKSNGTENQTVNKKKKKKPDDAHNLSNQSKFNKSNTIEKKKKKKFKHPEPNIPLSNVRLKAYCIHPKKFKNKIKYGNKLTGKRK